MSAPLTALAVIVSFIATAPAQTKSSALNTFDQKTHIGVADFRSDRQPCLFIENGQLPTGTPVHLIFSSRPQRPQDAVVLEKLTTSCTPDQDAPEGASFYVLKVVGASPPPGEVAIVLAGTAKPTIDKRGVVSIDLEGDGRREYFRSCTSSEGVHLTIWSGKPLVGKRLWHSYYYLGYDTEPSCTAKETALPD